MTPQRIFLLKVVGVAILSFVTAAAFSAYHKPGLLVEFANQVLCN